MTVEPRALTTDTVGHTIEHTIGEAGLVEFVSVRELRSRSAADWRSLAREKDVVGTSNGKPIAVLSATTASTVEASLAALRQ